MQYNGFPGCDGNFSHRLLLSNDSHMSMVTQKCEFERFYDFQTSQRRALEFSELLDFLIYYLLIHCTSWLQSLLLQVPLYKSLLPLSSPPPFSEKESLASEQFHPAADGHTVAEAHSQTSGRTCGRVGGRTEGSRGAEDTARRPTKSVNLGPWGSQSLNHQPSRDWT